MQRSSNAFRVIAVVMALYFVFAAAVQLNDPDAELWTALYVAAAAVTLFAVRRPPVFWVPGALAVVAVVWAIVLMPTAFESSFTELFRSWEMMSAGMEVGREFLGLLVVGVWMAMLANRSRHMAAHA